MKNPLLSFTIVLTLMTSCVSNRVARIPNNTTISSLDKDRIEILGTVEGNSGGGRMWVLFLPIGWAKDRTLKSNAYLGALKKYPNANGLIDHVQTIKKTTVPLIIVTPQVKTVKVTGTAYHIRTDAELEEYLKTKSK